MAKLTTPLRGLRGRPNSHVSLSNQYVTVYRIAPYEKRAVLETDPPTPVTQYAVHKVFNEWQAKEYREKHGMTITGLRAAHIAGTDKLIGSVDHVQCIVQPALGERVVFDYRDRMRCVVHVDDIAEVFVTLALARRPQHAVYNSGGETLSLGDLAGMVREVIPDADISFRNEAGGEESTTAYMFDNRRLAEEFGISYAPYRERVAQMIDAVRASSDRRLMPANRCAGGGSHAYDRGRDVRAGPAAPLCRKPALPDRGGRPRGSERGRGARRDPRRRPVPFGSGPGGRPAQADAAGRWRPRGRRHRPRDRPRGERTSNRAITSC